MKYILNHNISLRSYPKIPFCYYRYGEKMCHSLTLQEFEILLLCDGKNELEESDTIKKLILEKHLCHPTISDNRELTKWQKLHFYSNNYMPSIIIELTGKCNLNCIHCFNAIDNAPLTHQFSFEEIIKLLDEAEECGVHCFTLTGGEPLFHPQFIEIVKEIYNRRMFVDELNTNGLLITQELLDEFKKIGCNPLIKISFDGLGYHDWMRNKKGVEEKTIDAIKLCVKNGFKVKIQYNINHHNKSSIDETLVFLDSLGVKETRLIRTTPAPRWLKNSNGKTFSISEYYDIALQIVKTYVDKKLKMNLAIWQILDILKNAVFFKAMEGTVDPYRDNIPFCRGARGMIAIGANGTVYPCLQMSGRFDELHIELGNVKKEGLAKILDTNSEYMKFVCQNIRQKYEFNKDCQKCKYFKYCWGGCSAIGMIAYNTVLGKDAFCCYFYENDYYHKFLNVLKGYVPITNFDTIAMLEKEKNNL